MKTHEDYSYEPRTLIPSGSGVVLDLSNDPLKRRIRWVFGIGGTCSVQGREKGYVDGSIVHYSTTGAYTGADAQSATIIGERFCNWDKIYVASTSSPVQVLLVTDEVF